MDEALPLLEETLQSEDRQVGGRPPRHPLGHGQPRGGYRAVGKMDRALPLLKESLQLHTARLGADHPRTFISMGTLAMGYRAVGKMDGRCPCSSGRLPASRSVAFGTDTRK